MAHVCTHTKIPLYKMKFIERDYPGDNHRGFGDESLSELLLQILIDRSEEVLGIEPRGIL